MPRRPLAIFVIAALFVSSGAHIALLQSYAWAAMAVRATRSSSPRQELAKAFDGNHPCALCLKVRGGAKPEQGTLRSPTDSKVDLMPATSLVVDTPRGAHPLPDVPAGRADELAVPPASPPPRTQAA